MVGFLYIFNFKNNPNLIFTCADKGNCTVVMNRDVYLRKMNDLLSDPCTYSLVDKDPTKIITRDLKDLLTRWVREGYISDLTAKSLFTSDGILPRAYELPKIHKITPYALFYPPPTSVLYIHLPFSTIRSLVSISLVPPATFLTVTNWLIDLTIFTLRATLNYFLLI